MIVVKVMAMCIWIRQKCGYYEVTDLSQGGSVTTKVTFIVSK